jgi:hypothetical protein
MIIRLVRATIREGHEETVYGVIRSAKIDYGSPAGLEALLTGRRRIGRTNDFVSATAWRDADALAAFYGPDWATSLTVPGMDEALEDVSVSYFEGIASEFGRLLDGDDR